jgi:hypothetical protein
VAHYCARDPPFDAGYQQIQFSAFIKRRVALNQLKRLHISHLQPQQV